MREVENIFWCCYSNMPLFAPSHDSAKNGEVWTCPTCDEQWEFVKCSFDKDFWRPVIPV